MQKIHEHIILVAEKLVDGTGAAALSHGAVAIKAGRIIEVGPTNKLRGMFPAATEYIEHPGCTMLPGLIDSHVHLTFSAGTHIARDLQSDTELLLGLRAAANARQALQAGVTTVRDLGGRGTTTIELRGAMTTGVVPGPRMLVAGRPITIPGGHLHYLGGCAQGVTEVARLTKELIDQGVDVIKIIATGGNATPGSDPLKAAFSLEELRVIVDVANAAGVQVTAHARGIDGIRAVTDAGIHGIEHCRMEVAPGKWEFDEKLAHDIAERRIHVAPTLAASYRAFQRKVKGGDVALQAGAIPLPIRQQNARLLRENGVHVVVGTDAGASLARFDEAVHLELELLVGAGWTPLEAIHAGTLGAATAIGRDSEIGSLEPGKRADALIVQDDPTSNISDIRAVRKVYMDGRIVVQSGTVQSDSRPIPWPWSLNDPR